MISTREAEHQVRPLRAAGQVRRLRRGIYTDGPGNSRIEHVAAAAARMDAVASHETAAVLWGIPTLGLTQPIQVTRARRCQGATHEYEGMVLYHAGLDKDHVTVHRGVPITTPARTVMDIARNRPFRAGVVAADAALRTRLCGAEELIAVAESCRRWPGVRRAKRVAAFADSRSGSPLESISRVAFHHYGLPRPILQAVVGGYDEVDFLWERYRVIGEADGMGKYTSPEVLRNEKLRQEGLAQLGFTVFRWTWRDAYRRPDALAHRAFEILKRHGL
jgi:Protein of unknown function (DUF559)